MKRISELAMAAVLASGMVGTALVQPAVAQKKKDDKAPGMKLTPAVQKPAGEAQKALAANDFATAETQIAAAEVAAAAGATTTKYITAALRFDLERSKLSAAQKANPNAPIDQSTLAKPLEVLIANPKTPAASLPQFNYVRGTLAFNARQYPQAIQYLSARQLGYQDPELDVRIATAKLEGSDVRGGLTDLSAAIDKQTAAGQKAPESYYRVGTSRAVKAKLNPEQLDWFKKWITAYPTAKNWRDVVFIYGLQDRTPIAAPDNQQQIDLWRLLRAARALADQYDYREYAQKVFDRGLPAEAATVLKEGQAAGKLTGNADAQSLLVAAQGRVRVDTPLTTLSTQAKASATGKLASQTGDAYLGTGQLHTQAAELYRLALQKGGVNNDEVNTRLGIALARSGDKAGAQAAFSAVGNAGVRGQIAQLWMTWLNTPPTA